MGRRDRDAYARPSTVGRPRWVPVGRLCGSMGTPGCCGGRARLRDGTAPPPPQGGPRASAAGARAPCRRRPSRCRPPRARRRPRRLTYAGGSALDASRHRGRDMTILLVVALLVGLLLPLELLGLPPSWRGRPAVPGRTPEPDGEDVLPAPAEDERSASDGMTAQWGLFTQEFVRGRLHALEEELARLDREPDVFARAFHTLAA